MRKKVIILGAGFGGLRAALILGKKIGNIADITIIDRNEHHTYTPLLYEVATTSKEIAGYIKLHQLATYPIVSLLSHLPIKFIQDEVMEMDIKNCGISLKSGLELKYDYLVISLGSETNYFDIPGLKKNALELKSFTDALKIRDAIWNLASGGKKNLKIIIGGGGSTGAELAGEIQEWLCQLKKDYEECSAETHIIEAGPSILGGFDARVIKKVTKRLNRLGVNIVTGEVIEKASDKKIFLNGGKSMDFDVLIWAGGVKANSISNAMPLKLEKRGRTEVSNSMLCLVSSPSLKLGGSVYGIGDIVCSYNPRTSEPVPMVARAALSQASVAAKNIVSEINGDRPTAIYKPMNYPYIIPVGGKFAVAKIGPVIISGFWGWVFKGFVELNYLISIMPISKALKIWAKGLKIFIQNDRLG
ncbi:MAG: NAD(P)/FAD-dependent oxidoreductase [Candidatus Colwellbacteria bacterium]|nr:NAD(P)/FAD-dependent oxidoreductase [Candidatus Colwellbacteria bacterium]